MNEPGAILIIDDEASLRQTLARILQRAGFTVTTAAGGKEAFELLRQQSFDLVYMDIRMPDINGLELISFIKKNEAHKTTPILIISTASSERDRERGMTLGASGYLVKPFTAEELVQHALEQMGAASASGAHA